MSNSSNLNNTIIETHETMNNEKIVFYIKISAILLLTIITILFGLLPMIT